MARNGCRFDFFNLIWYNIYRIKKGGDFIATPVKCFYCGQSFDRNFEQYVKPNSCRYAHATCYLREKELNPKKIPDLEIVDPNDEVECAFCKKVFSKSTTLDFKTLPGGGFAHAACYEADQRREKTDQEKLNELLIKMYDLEFVPPRVQRQIKEYNTKYNYSYSGMLKTLEYMHFVKNLPVDKVAFNEYGLGLMKSYYDRAHDYYYAIWEAQQNQYQVLGHSAVDELLPKQIAITIPPPQRKEKRHRKFSFLDREGK